MIAARHGFTLLEILVAIGLTAALSLVSFQIFQQVQTTINRARPAQSRNHTAEIFLDRFERELVGTTLVVKPEAAERLEFPWVFIGQDHVSDGNDTDAIRFITQTPVRVPGRPSPGLRTVSYGVAESLDGQRLDLYRAEERLGQGLRKEIRLDEAQPVLEDIHTFSLSFGAGAEGEGSGSWDSTQEGTLDQLPEAIEVALQLYERDELGERVPGDEHQRRVRLRVRPFERAVEDDELAAGECDTGPTIAGCIGAYRADLDADPEGQQVLSLTPAAGAGCWIEADPTPELSALHEAFFDVIGIAAEDACIE